MSLIQRKPRPLKRDTAEVRDDRLFIVACDDTYAPKQYFDFFKIPRIQIYVVTTEDGTSSANYVLGRLLDIKYEEDDELWLLLDTDHCTAGSHFPSFISALKEARQQRVNIALSKPCFELWLLLHHVEQSQVTALVNATQTEQELRKVLGEYNKNNLRCEDYPLANVAEACIRAELLDKTVSGGDQPTSNTSRIYLLWQAIAEKALPSQLPAELGALLAST